MGLMTSATTSSNHGWTKRKWKGEKKAHAAGKITIVYSHSEEARKCIATFSSWLRII